jgi:hypothetical protein
MTILIHLLGRWNMKLHEEDFPTIPYLIKLYMDLGNVPIISYIIKEISNFKALNRQPYLQSGAHGLIGHTKVQQFWFYMHDDSILVLQYELLCTL